MYWYVLFVKTGREHRVEQLLRERLDSDLFMPFIPLQERIIKISGLVKKELQLLFPSYVFVESDLSNQEFIKSINSFIYSSSDIIELLKYSDTEISLRKSEVQILLSLYNGNHCIESSSGVIEGDKIYIIDGPLKGRESIVKHINRHKREAKIEIEFFGSIRLVSVALEIISKVS